VRQRLRWERSGAVRNHFRKHVDMACFWRPGFSFANGAVLLESWFFSTFCAYGILAWTICFLIRLPENWGMILLTLYLCYLTFELLQVLATLYYTLHFRRDLVLSLVFFLAPLYGIFNLVVRLIANTEEIFFRKSFEDNYVPLKVRRATWRW
jgi:biofilm PGA synthesis N-glycosyltransferase PgaC